jgi:NADH dehydrogenase
MRVAIFGGTGFVGSYIIDALIENGHQPVALVRPGSEDKLRHPNECEQVGGDIDDPDAIAETLAGSEAAIYNIGILREFPERGITYEAMHFEGAVRVIDAAQSAGAKRFLLMSANGVKPDGTGYQRTKYAAEQYLQGTDLAWTIFRPSVLFGDPRGRMEFATQLYQDLIRSPLPAPLFYGGLLPFDAGSFRMAPVHVEEVAAAFAKSLESEQAIGRIYPVCGPDALEWKTLIQTLADVAGKHKLSLPAPAWGVKIAASVFDRFEFFPITRDQITMLMEGNTCRDSAWSVELGIERRPFTPENLSYLL